MECVEAYAFKASFRPEMAVKSTQQALFEDGWVGHGPNGVSGDDCFVDDLFDFSNEDVVEEIVEEEEGEKGCFSFSSQEQAGEDKSNSSSFLVTELSIPADDLANLEWLSHFVEDSFSEFSQPYPAGNPAEKTHNENQNRSEPEVGTASPKTPCFQTPVPGKARSKRSRTSGRVWSRGSFSFDESSSTTSSSSSSSSTSSLIYPNTTQYLDSFYSVARPPAKKQRKKPAIESGETQPQRRCSHCHVQKTPQWRTGPLGAKTLCNACGVRYKSGRLLPEYRPACSPTFATDVHSNNHRKVLEMRRKKEMVGPESVFAPAVHSF